MGADRGDNIRTIFIKRYLYALNKAIRDGLDIRGYFYWTLMDNFEWAEGYKMKFGLYEVNFHTQARTLRESSKLFADIVKKPGIDSRGYIVELGELAPDFTMQFLTGEKVTLSNLRGKLLFYNLLRAGAQFVERKCLTLKKMYGRSLKIMI